MESWSLPLHLAPTLALAAACACAAAAPQQPKPARPSPIPPSAKALTPEQKTADDQAYFMAVSAYSRGDYDQARDYVRQILAVDPANPDALALRRRISAAEKASQP